MTEDEVQSVVEKYPIGPSGCPEWSSEDGSVRLILGDCLEVLPTLGGIDAVVTDPQYGIGMSLYPHSNLKMEKEEWDSRPADLSRLPNVPRIIWGGNYFDLPPTRCFLVWDKRPMPPSYADCELAWTSLDRNAAMWRGKVGNDVPVKNRVHPTQKPVGLMIWCLGFILDSIFICDPFMGSGTTGVACIRTGRRFVGIEIEPKYFEIAVKRCKKAIREDKSSFQIRSKPRVEQTGFFERKKK